MGRGQGRGNILKFKCSDLLLGWVGGGGGGSCLKKERLVQICCQGGVG